MRYYTQNVMKLELTKEELTCCKEFANFLNKYAEEIDDDPNTLCDVLTDISDMEYYGSAFDRDYMKNYHHIDIEII